jgi:hypothetical protein
MSEIVEWLRATAIVRQLPQYTMAADEIERLEAIPKCDHRYCTFGNGAYEQLAAANGKQYAEIKQLEEQLATSRELRDYCHDDLRAARVSVVALNLEIERLTTLADTRNLMLGQLRAQFDDMVKQRDRALDQAGVSEDRLIKDNEQLIAALKLFVGCTYPVAVQINPRGYDWLPEKSLDHALSVARLALGEMK